MQMCSDLWMRIVSVLVAWRTPLPAPSEPLVQGREMPALGDTVPPAPRDHPDHLKALRCRVHCLTIPLRSTIKTLFQQAGFFHILVYLFLSKHQTCFSSLGQILFPCPPSSLCFKSLHHLLSFSLSLLLFLLFHHL